MKIITGFSKIQEISPLIEAGAEELFCGIIANNKNKLYGHRPNTRQYNIGSIEDLKEAIKITHQKNKKINLVVNEGDFSPENIKIIIPIIKDLDNANIDGFITKDLSFLLMCQKEKIKAHVHLSSVAACLNSESIKFFQKLGIKRYILPQQLTPAEFKKIKNKNKIETEVFFHMVNNCPNIDGLCRFHETELFDFEKSFFFYICRLIPKIEPYYSNPIQKMIPNQKSKKTISMVSTFFQHRQQYDFLDRMYDFFNLNVDYIKLGTRGFPTIEKIKRVKLTKNLLTILEEKLSKNQFKQKAQKLIFLDKKILYQDDKFEI